jgi:hypothetical protein
MLTIRLATVWVGIVAHTLMLLCVCASGNDVGEVRSVLATRLQAIQNLTAGFTVDESYFPPPGYKEKIESANVPGKPQSYITNSPRRMKCTYRYLNGRYWYEFELDDASAAKLPPIEARRRIDCFLIDGFERYRRQLNKQVPKGLITDKQDPVQQIIDLGLGVRAFGDQKWLTPDDFEGMMVIAVPGGAIELVWQDPSGAGARRHSWRVAPSHGYALTKYLVTFVGSSEKIFELTCSELRNEAGVLLPYRMEADWFGPIDKSGRQAVTKRSILDIARYELNSPANTVDSFHITWPLGTEVFDERFNKTIRIKSKPQILDDKKIQELVGKHVLRSRGPSIALLSMILIVVVPLFYWIGRRAWLLWKFHKY